MTDEEVGNGLYCFLSADRPCSAECMAYMTEPPAGDDFKGKQFANCMLLVNAHRVGKHIVVLARAAAESSNMSLPIPPPKVR